MNRRKFLVAATALVSASAGLVACGVTPSQAAQDVASIAAAFQSSLPQFSSVTGIDASKMGVIGTAVADLQKVAAAFSGADNATAQTLVGRIEADVNAVVGVAAALPLIPPPINMILMAATVLLPVIETAIGMVVKPQVALRASAAQMSPDQARLILRGSVVKP